METSQAVATKLSYQQAIPYSIHQLFNIKDKSGTPTRKPRDFTHKSTHRYFKTFLIDELAPYCRSQQKAHPEKPLSVFISYAWAIPGSPTYQQDKIYEVYVEKLAKDIQLAGCEIYLDRWYDQGGKVLPDFLEKMSKADRFIPVGTHLYLTKYEKRAQLENQTEHVVRAEGALLNHIAIHSTAWREKIIPILLEGKKADALPFLLEPNIEITFFKDQDYFEQLIKLVRSLYRIDNRDAVLNKKLKTFFKELNTLAELAKS